jgi:predicted small integral membrane protein
MVVRTSKILMVLSVALFSTFVVFNNIVDYGTNFAFVQHVLQMDTVFSQDQAEWRNISSPIMLHLSYVLIILWEALIATLCWVGAFQLWRSINDINAFNKTKDLAVAGLTAGILLWFTGFIAIGGEWFLMWQSDDWDGQETASRFVMILGIMLIYLNTPDRDENAS